MSQDKSAELGWPAASVTAAALLLLLQPSCLFSQGQRLHDFTVAAPLPERHALILGFMGGRDSWDDEKKGVRKLALKLRSLNLEGVHVETVENKKRSLAVQLIRDCLDRNRDGRLSEPERRNARLILYGQSFGGAAVVKLARQLEKIGVPVLLTVQVDSVGRGDAEIPANVRRAANLFQRDGLFIRGESRIRAQDPVQTEIIGNFEFDYSDKRIDISEVSWFRRLFRTAHTKMDLDPEVWAQVERLILDEAGLP